MSVGTETFLRLLQQQQQAAPTPSANIQRPYQVLGARGLTTPPMALRRPQPPSAMPTAPKLSPMMQAIAKRAAMSKLTPSAGQVGLPTGSGARPQPSAPTMPQGGGAPAQTTFGQRFAQPQTQALLGAAIAGAEASGYQDRPVSLGQVLGRMGAGAMGSYQAAEDRQAKLAASLAAAQRQKRLDEEKAAYDAEMLRLKKLEIQGVSGKAATAQRLQESRLRRDLRKDFEGDAKYFGEAQQFWKDVVNYSKPEQSSASDLALVFSYMKMLDPDSVVREGEQMQVRGLGGIGSEARAFLSRLGVTTEGTYEGGMLIIDAPIRANIREAAALRFGDLAKSQAALEDYTADEGARAGLSTDFFKSKIKGDGNIKRPYVVNTLDDLPETAKSGEYAVVNGVFMQIREQG